MTSQLTARQKEILLFGSSSLAGRGFIADEEVSAWSEHRAELLLAAAGSLARPDAYFRYELCEVTPSWIEDVYQLYRRKLLPAPAQRAVIGEEAEPLFAAEARKRQATSTGGKRPQLAEKLPQAARGRARDKAAKAAGADQKIPADPRVHQTGSQRESDCAD